MCIFDLCKLNGGYKVSPGDGFGKLIFHKTKTWHLPAATAPKNRKNRDKKQVAAPVFYAYVYLLCPIIGGFSGMFPLPKVPGLLFKQKTIF